MRRRPGSGTDAHLYEDINYVPTDIFVTSDAAGSGFPFMLKDGQARVAYPALILTRGATGWEIDDFDFSLYPSNLRMVRRSQMRDDGYVDPDLLVPFNIQTAYDKGPHGALFGHDTRNEERWIFFIAPQSDPDTYFEFTLYTESRP